jgi:phage gpG-like protein
MSTWDPVVLSIFNRIKNKEDLYKVIAGDMQSAVGRNWRKEESLPGQPFAALSPAYRKRKKGKRILQETGAAIRSMNNIFSNNYAAVYLPPATARYMATHVLGLTVNFPARSETFKRSKNKSGRFKKLKAFEERGITQGYSFRAHSVKFPQRNPFNLANEDFNSIEKRILNHISGK